MRQAVVEHPMEQRGVEAGLLDSGKELARLADAALGLPTGQRLDGDDLSGAHVDDRLEVGADLTPIECVDELRSRVVELRGGDADGGPGSGDRGFGGVEGSSETDARQPATDSDPCRDAGGAERLA